MAVAERPKKYTAQMPPCAVVPQMDTDLRIIAADHGLSLNDVMREGFLLFLEKHGYPRSRYTV